MGEAKRTAKKTLKQKYEELNACYLLVIGELAVHVAKYGPVKTKDTHGILEMHQGQAFNSASALFDTVYQAACQYFGTTMDASLLTARAKRSEAEPRDSQDTSDKSTPPAEG